MKLNSRLLGLSLGVFAGATLMGATLWLVVKGGDPVGPHLSLLGEYLPGYRVSVAGSLVGFAYGFAIGDLLGWLMGVVYNRISRTGRRC
jgi:hypothetical protein